MNGDESTSFRFRVPCSGGVKSSVDTLLKSKNDSILYCEYSSTKVLRKDVCIAGTSHACVAKESWIGKILPSKSLIVLQRCAASIECTKLGTIPLAAIRVLYVLSLVIN